VSIPPRSAKALQWFGVASALALFALLRVLAIQTTAFNWDELVLLQDVSRSASEGVLRSSGHPGLPQALLIPWVEGCSDEIAVGRKARLAWLGLTWTALVGVFAVLVQLLPASPTRRRDAALGTALLGLAPVFLEWSVQVRTDQVALCGGAWGAAALLFSRQRPAFALGAGLALGVGWLGTEKLAYLAALAGLLAAGDLWVRREWKPGREALRAGGVALGALAVLAAWRAIVSTHFELAASQGSPISPEGLANRIDSFAFYRNTIGYSQYLDALPDLLPQLGVFAAVVAAALFCPAARTRRLALAAAVLALGALVGAFHAGAFAYFLMTLGVFAAVGLTLALPSLRSWAERWPGSAPMATAVAWSALALFAGLHALSTLYDTQAVQRESLGFVQRNFSPEQAGFHPEAGLFCSARQPLGTWLSRRIYRSFGRGERRERNAEELVERFRAEPVHYLVQSFRLNQFPVSLRRFWAEHYQPYRASVFVAGRRLVAGEADSLDFELLVPGAYRWLPRGEAHAVEIDGATLAPGEVVQLPAGRHRAHFPDAEGQGALLLAMNDPPGTAPMTFYKSY